MKTGIIGLGTMGNHLARNLAKANLLETVYNRTLATAEQFARECACPIATTPAELAQQCELIIICITCDKDVLEIINAIRTSLKMNTIVVDTSTVSVATAKKAATILKEHDAHFLDCPVSGGVEGAKNGTLAMMVGGDKMIFEQARPTLDAIATHIAYIGPTGSGQASKAVNQIMAAGINQAVTEALAFGKAMNLPMEKVIDIIATGAAGNWFLEHRGKSILAGTYAPGFKLSLHHKDLSICQEMIKSIGAPALPVVEMTLHHYQRLIDEGYGNDDISTLFHLKQTDLALSRTTKPC